MLQDYGINDEELVLYLLYEGRKYALNERKILVTNDRIEKKTQKMLKSSSMDAILMAKTIYNVRKSLHHRGVIIGKAGDRDWGIIKDIAHNALEFCNDFSLSKQEGFVEYIKVAAKKMGKFMLNKIPNMHSTLCQEYEALGDLQSDKYPEYTDRAYKEYNRTIIDQLGDLLVDYKKIPDKFVCFMQVGVKCHELNVTPEIYIKAQFEGLAWTKGVPDPLQFVTEKAIERVQKYLYQHKNDVPERKEKDEAMVNKLKAIRKL